MMALSVWIRLLKLIVAVEIAQLAPPFASSQELTYVCNNTGVDFELRPDSQYCYRIWQADENFIEANKTCGRNNAVLVRIDSREENDYINRTFFAQLGHREFWIGLTDIDEEGVFRWTDGSSLTYNGWAGSSPSGNRNNYDCVKFTADGWRIEEGFCATSQLPFLCRQDACSTSDGQNCISTTPTDTSVSVAAIVPSVLIPLVVISAIAIVMIVLIIMYKCYNDYFYKYLCCCLYRASQFKVTTMQQEIQQLRHQLSQQKLSFSGRYQPGELSKKLAESKEMPGGKGLPSDPGSPQRNISTSTWGQFHTKIVPMRSSSTVSGPPSLVGSYGTPPYPQMQHSFSSSAYVPFKTRPSLPAIKEKQVPITEISAQQLQEKPQLDMSGDSEPADSEDTSSTKSGPVKDRE